MPKPYDVTTKFLLQSRPLDWLRFFGLAATDVEIVDADLSTVIAAADKALLLKLPGQELLDVEFQSTFEADELERFLEYSVLLLRHYHLPVRTIVLLLRPRADHTSLTGVLELKNVQGEVYHWFRYYVVRLWETPVEAILAGGLGTLPLAPMADLTQVPVADVIRRMRERITTEASPLEANDLWASTYVLMGLRYAPDTAQRLIQGVRTVDLRDSSTYQEILREGLAEGLAKGLAEGREVGIAEGREEGQMEEARALLLRLGHKRLGQPDTPTRDTLAAIRDKARLEALTERVLDVETWQELLADTE